MTEQFTSMIEPIARELLGEPNRALSSKGELRYGARGSFAVDLGKGTWFDHETSVGGGTLDLVTRETGLSGPERMRWLIEHGFIVGEPHRPTNGQHGPNLGPIVATYDYVDEAGALLFQVTRHDPKDFRQRKPDKNGRDGWSWSVKGVRNVPYRLPDLLERIEQTVFIVEGEKDCDRLWALGLPATTNAGGAGKWRAELSQYFRNADVVIIPDRDPQKKHPKTGELMFHQGGRPMLPGQDHAHAVALSLKGVAAQVRVLELWNHWPEMPVKGDVSDWLASGHSANELYGLVERLPVWEPPLGGSHIILTLEEWIARILAEADRLFGDLLTTTTRAIINAPTGLGKTMLGLGLAMRMAAGTGFLHWKGVRPATVLFVDGEMTARGLKRRLVAEVLRFGSKPIGMHALCHEDIENFQPLNTPQGQQQIEEVINRIGKVDFIFFDNIMSLIGGDMKEEDSWRQTLPWIKSLTKRSIGQLWLHHTGHDESHGYGTKTREWQMDVVGHCKRIEEPGVEVAFKLTFPKARERTIENRGDFGDVIIELRGNEWSSRQTDLPAEAKKLQPLTLKFLDLLNEAIASNNLKLDGFPATTLEAWRLLCLKRGLLDKGKPDSSRSLFSKNKVNLVVGKRIVVDGELVRLVNLDAAYQAAMDV